MVHILGHIGAFGSFQLYSLTHEPFRPPRSRRSGCRELSLSDWHTCTRFCCCSLPDKFRNCQARGCGSLSTQWRCQCLPPRSPLVRRSSFSLRASSAGLRGRCCTSRPSLGSYFFSCIPPISSYGIADCGSVNSCRSGSSHGDGGASGAVAAGNTRGSHQAEFAAAAGEHAVSLERLTVISRGVRQVRACDLVAKGAAVAIGSSSSLPVSPPASAAREIEKSLARRPSRPDPLTRPGAARALSFLLLLCPPLNTESASHAYSTAA